MSISFSHESAPGKELMSWWLGLEDDKAGRAELKRCSCASEVMMTIAYQRLCQRLRPFFPENNNYWQIKLAMISGLASHIKPETEHKKIEKTSERKKYLARQMADTGESSRSAVSELRFRRLLQRDSDELYHPMIRIIRMLKGKANLYSLSESMFYWGDSIKKDWAFAYFS